MWRSELERLEPVDAPQANVRAPLPHILASDNALLFVYFTQSSNRSFADMDLRGATSDVTAHPRLYQPRPASPGWGKIFSE